MTQTEKPVLTSAFMISGYVFALDQYGKQMPDYQGPYTEVRKLIEEQGIEIERRGP